MKNKIIVSNKLVKHSYFTAEAIYDSNKGEIF